ncbi:DEAD/DEAH box helicase [Coraliomargarita sp. SDUM461003]|uniref:DEAD/DEAH box helicase n=1 Tax=Thalassobacterium maritimum TaxID=3041265 RepID=A0ABU1AW95_9BACT|nr:DEAD/DEAH box helicase [Coraliomargarita sp. SDUM461003]MDQ8208420.1 DEAD/DEAH box helicase [Coraliomargarita sp. SDUM461003]
MTFSQLGMASYFSQALTRHGFVAPTPIQSAAIPAILEGSDVLGVAKTGSGKTAAFVLPILQKLDATAADSHRAPSVLVLVPTRELADQVAGVWGDFIPSLSHACSCVAVYGGVSINTQMQAMNRVDVLVATPGRLLDLLDKNAVALSNVSTLVLDEADKLLNLGFEAELNQLLGLLPGKRQNLLFSATLNETISAMQRVILKDPKLLQVDEVGESIEHIRQHGYFVSEERKGPLLRYLIKEGGMQRVLVFVSSRKKADNLTFKLRKNKINAWPIHSKMGQQTRKDTLEGFKEGLFPVLIATDLLARGIDIDCLSQVINYELPRSPKDYLHRIGRTGRVEASGEAISLITPEEAHHFKVIQKKMGQKVPMAASDEIDLSGY